MRYTRTSRRALTFVRFLVVRLFRAVAVLRLFGPLSVLLGLLLVAHRAVGLLLVRVGCRRGRLLGGDARRRWSVRILSRWPVRVLPGRSRPVVVRSRLRRWPVVREHRVLGHPRERGHLTVGVETAERKRSHRFGAALHPHQNHCGETRGRRKEKKKHRD